VTAGKQVVSTKQSLELHT